MGEQAAANERPVANLPERVPDQPAVRAPHPGWRTVKSVSLLLIVAATLLLVWLPLMQWGTNVVEDADGSGAVLSAIPRSGAIAAMLAFGPALSVAVGLLKARRGFLTPAGGVGGAIVCFVAWQQLAKLQGTTPKGGDFGAWNVSAYGPLTLVAAAALTLGWLLLTAVALAGRRSDGGIAPAWGGWSAVALGTVLAVFVAGGVVGARWYGMHRGIDHVATQPLAKRDSGVPKDLNRVAWSADLEGKVEVVDRYLVAVEQHGISVRDAVTGREHWHYRRQLWPETRPTFGISADRRTVVTLWRRFDNAVILAGFDLATGELRWSNAQDGADFDFRSDPIDRLLQIGDTAIVARGKGTAVGVNVRTGTSPWRWQPAAGCKALQFVQAASVPAASVPASSIPAIAIMAVAVDCSGTTVVGGRSRLADGSYAPADTKVIGISATDGVERWTWKPPSPVATLDTLIGAEPGMAVVGDALRVATTEHADVTLDAATGAVRHADAARRPAPSGNAIHTVVRGKSTTVYLGDTRSRGNAAAVDEAGATRWARAVPELDSAYVTSSAVIGDTGYALVIPTDRNGLFTPLGVYRTRLLIAMDLTTGAVLAKQEISFPDDCGCGGVIYPPGIWLYPGDGLLVMTFSTANRGVRVIAYV
jgi:hypothetical protein